MYLLPSAKFSLMNFLIRGDFSAIFHIEFSATFSYAYRMTNDTKWSDRAYLEMLNAGSDSWGPSTDKWNTGHFLDTAELSAAYGIGYDWLYESLNDTQKEYIRDTMIKWGLEPGRQVFEESTTFGWWSAATIKGNWVSEIFSRLRTLRSCRAELRL